MVDKCPGLIIRVVEDGSGSGDQIVIESHSWNDSILLEHLFDPSEISPSRKVIFGFQPIGSPYREAMPPASVPKYSIWN